MTDNKTQLVLTKAQLDTICTAARDSWVAGVVETFKCFGLDLTSPEGGPVRASDYAIPEDQWRTIAHACGEDRPSPLRQVNHMLDWMNYGPSSFARENVSS